MTMAEINQEHTQSVDAALWKLQHSWNQRIEDRLTAVEKKVVFASGFAAAIGALVGSGLAVFLLQGLFGGAS